MSLDQIIEVIIVISFFSYVTYNLNKMINAAKKDADAL